MTLGRDNALIARELRVSVRSVQRWHQAWEHGGTSALESKGPASRPKLSEALFEVLEQELPKGPAAYGWPDQTWTLARIKTLIGHRFHRSMTLSAIAQMLHRHGFSHQSPWDPVPQQPHRRMSDRDRPHHDDITPTKSVTNYHYEGIGVRRAISYDHRPRGEPRAGFSGVPGEQVLADLAEGPRAMGVIEDPHQVEAVRPRRGRAAVRGA